MKSDEVKKGKERAPHRSLFFATGMKRQDMKNIVAPRQPAAGPAKRRPSASSARNRLASRTAQNSLESHTRDSMM